MLSSMADDKDNRRKITGYHMPAASRDEQPEAPKKRVGRRQFNAGEARGLAAFDHEERDPRGAAKKPAAPDHAVDDELRRARMEASSEPEDDGMVATSRSFFDDMGQIAAPPGGKKGRGGKVVAGAGGEEETSGRRSGAAKWIIGGLVVVAAGVGTTLAITAGGGADAPADPAEVATAEGTRAGATEPDEAEEPAAEPEEEPSAVEGDAVADAHGGDAASAEAGGAEAPVTLPPMSAGAPAAWAPKVEAMNAWVSIAAAPEGRLVGISSAEASDARATLRTGLRPEVGRAAPKKAYRVQAHEVTWGELGAAETLAGMNELARPTWLPRDAKRAADLPATGVPWALARAFCQGLGGDLPSESEWEWAARGPDDRYLPWGRAAFGPSEVHTVVSGRVPVVAVMTAKLDRTPDEPPIHDLLGNAQEWTRDSWLPSEPGAGKDAKTATHKVIKGWPLTDPGASIPSEGSTFRAAACADPSCLAAESATLERVGFRCVIGPGS